MSLNLTELFVFITGTTHLLFFKPLNNFDINFEEKFGLAASWIKTLEILLFLMLFNALNEDSDLFFPPVIIDIFFNFIFFRFFLCFLFMTNTIFLNFFDSLALSI